jgi:hypothetical protein
METINLAQSAGDAACVAYALALLSKLLERERAATLQSSSQAEELLRRCRQRAADLRLWRLHSMASRSAASLSSPAQLDWLSFNPVVCREWDVTAGRVPGASGRGGSGAAQVSHADGASPLSIPVPEQWAMQGRQHAQRAAAFDRAGHRVLSNVAGRLQLACLAAGCDDIVNAESVCTLARSLVLGFAPEWLRGAASASRGNAAAPRHDGVCVGAVHSRAHTSTALAVAWDVIHAHLQDAESEGARQTLLLVR